MIRLFLASLILSTSISFLTGCTVATTPIVNNIGNLPPRDWSVAKHLKTGEACSVSLFGVLPLGGDSTLATAVINGRIRNIFVVDTVNSNFIIVGVHCLRVRGM